MSDKNTVPGFLPVHEICARFKLSRSAFYKRVRDGSLGQPVRLGRQSYLPVESVRRYEAWLRAQSMKTQRV